MSLTAADVAEIMRLVEQSSFDELTLEMDGIKLHLRRGGAASSPGAAFAAVPREADSQGAGASARSPERGATATPAQVTSGTAQSAAPESSVGAVRSAAPGPSVGAVPPAASVPSSVAANSNVQEITAPLLGTFYRAPKPGAPPFVEVGASVEEDTVVGIIEVMKLMNTVRAGVRGTVAEVVGRDGALVEYGEVILRVSRAG